ncbi:hypothetical protein SAMN06264364_14922 [Quadrisphaera granulorum]|uniref:Uncharacterized protein n=1 Tax=Quadrisphaera granulorum TaxID=317664 RepID=A0A315ZLA8_9ACTN|nr:hypothetical protein [Quadrisphaera granulorum]PWJ46286.1 hypothetical protein BXY45_14922 [Quadrisphaera granulorum]SZE99101.1 hypothetical protein SAMN06264364_14922 [Quadrisphaera granulorum]
MATWSRRGDVWGVLVPTDQATPGEEVVATRRDGTEKLVVIGTDLRHDRDDDFVWCSVEPLRDQLLGSDGSCAECGRGGARFYRRDSSGIGGMVCGRCSAEPDYCLSFA